ncbi:MAG: tyrosine--tRNA ligase [Nitrospinota bacterium]
MTFFGDLQARGLVHDHTEAPEFLRALEAGGLTLYCGFDPTSESLHVGSLMPIVGLMRFQRAGHRPIAVVGGATGMIGDPSGKSEERNLLGWEALARNIEGIRGQLRRFLGEDCALLNNADWIGALSIVDFLRDVGKHFTVAYMEAKESVKNRVAGAGISYTEFSYMLLQAYDFLYLHDAEGCALQIGGSDQWGNITAGIELIRRVRSKPAYGLTFPLITTSDGRKFGKTEAGNVWLDPARTSPYRFYQYWMQTSDADVGRFLRYFSFLPVEEIEQIEKSHMGIPEARGGQSILARLLTTLVHGDENAKSTERASIILFGGELDDIKERDLLAAAEEIPHTERKAPLPLSLVDTLVETKLSSSKGMARKDIQGGGVYVNNRRAGEESAVLSQNDLLFGKYVLLRKGKKNYHLVQFRQP